MNLKLGFDIDTTTIVVVVCMVLIIFAIAGATIHIDTVTASGKRIDRHNNNHIDNSNTHHSSDNASNNTSNNSNKKAVDVPDEAYLSDETRRHILLEQQRYYTDTCPMV